MQEKNRTKCEIYTRVMGYHRPVSQFNEGKKSEYYGRTYFNEKKSFNSDFIAQYGY
jgi:anaerobic ribonucleoside-triphosphate reductase